MGGDGCSSSSGSAGQGKPTGQASPRAEDARNRSAPASPPQPADHPAQAPAAASTPSGAPATAQQSPPAATGDFLRRDTDARWGVLPPKLQERLLNLHADAIPERYRTWLAAYVRELQRRDNVAAGP